MQKTISNDVYDPYTSPTTADNQVGSAVLESNLIQNLSVARYLMSEAKKTDRPVRELFEARFFWAHPEDLFTMTVAEFDEWTLDTWTPADDFRTQEFI